MNIYEKRPCSSIFSFVFFFKNFAIDLWYSENNFGHFNTVLCLAIICLQSQMKSVLNHLQLISDGDDFIFTK